MQAWRLKTPKLYSSCWLFSLYGYYLYCLLIFCYSQSWLLSGIALSSLWPGFSSRPWRSILRDFSLTVHSLRKPTSTSLWYGLRHYRQTEATRIGLASHRWIYNKLHLHVSSTPRRESRAYLESVMNIDTSTLSHTTAQSDLHIIWYLRG